MDERKYHKKLHIVTTPIIEMVYNTCILYNVHNVRVYVREYGKVPNSSKFAINCKFSVGTRYDFA